MSTITLENSNLKISIALKGAELQSILDQKDQTEYLWQADNQFWGRHAPILFPIVGKLKDDQYSYQGKIYELSQHGFARDMVFGIAEQTSDQVVLSLKYTEETLAKLPFKFLLQVSYRLMDNRLVTSYSVQNLDNQKMYFSVGAHPGFNVPLDKKLNFEDYYFEILPKAERNFIPVTKEVLLQSDAIEKTNQAKFAINRELFQDGVLIYETRGKTQVALKSDKSNKAVVFDYEAMPYLGIWSTYPEEAPFVCIEPWCGVADTFDTDGELSTKKGIISLKGKSSFSTEYGMTFF